MKCGNLNFLEPSGPPQACNGTALPLFMKSNCGNSLNFPNLNFVKHYSSSANVKTCLSTIPVLVSLSSNFPSVNTYKNFLQCGNFFIYLFIYLFSRLYDVATSSCANLTIILSSSSICLCHSSLLPLIPFPPSVL